MYEREDKRTYSGIYLINMYYLIEHFWREFSYITQVTQSSQAMWTMEGDLPISRNIGLDSRLMVSLEQKHNTVEVTLRMTTELGQPEGMDPASSNIVMVPVLNYQGNMVVAFYETESNRLIDTFWMWLESSMNMRGSIGSSVILQGTAVHAALPPTITFPVIPSMHIKYPSIPSPPAGSGPPSGSGGTLSGLLDSTERGLKNVGRSIDREVSGVGQDPAYKAAAAHPLGPHRGLAMPVVLERIPKDEKLKLLEQLHLRGMVSEEHYMAMRTRFENE